MAFFKSSYQSRYTKNRFMDKFTNYKRENFNTDYSKYFVVVPEKNDEGKTILGIYLNITKFQNAVNLDTELNTANFERSEKGSSSVEGTLDTPFEIRSTKPLISVDSDEYEAGASTDYPDFIKYDEALGLDSVYYTGDTTYAIKPRFTNGSVTAPESMDFKDYIQTLIDSDEGVKTFKDILEEINDSYGGNYKKTYGGVLELDKEGKEIADYKTDFPEEYKENNKFFLLIKKKYPGVEGGLEPIDFTANAFINGKNKGYISDYFNGQGLEFIGKNNTSIDYDVLGFYDANTAPPATMAPIYTSTSMAPTSTSSAMSTMTPTSTVSTTPAPKKNKFYVKCSNFIPWSKLTRFVNIFENSYNVAHDLDTDTIDVDTVSLSDATKAEAIIIYNLDALIKENVDTDADIKYNLNYVIGDSGVLVDISSLEIKDNAKPPLDTIDKKFVIVGTPLSNLSDNVNHVPVILHKLADPVGTISANRPYGYNIRQRSQGQDDIFIRQNAGLNFKPKTTGSENITNDTFYFSEVLNNTGFHIIPTDEDKTRFFKKLDENIKKEINKPILVSTPPTRLQSLQSKVYHPRNNLLNSLRTNFIVTRSPDDYGNQNKVNITNAKPSITEEEKNIVKKMIIQDTNYLLNSQDSLLVNRLEFRNRYVNTSAFFPRRYGIEGITGYFELLADTAFIAHYKSHQITMIRVLTERILKFIKANLEFIEAVCTVKGFNIEDVISKIIEGNLHDGIEYHCKYFYEDKRKRRILFDENGDPFIHKLTYETDKNGLTIYFIYVFEKKNADKNEVSLSVAESSSGFFDNTMNDSQKFVNLFNEYIDGSVDRDAADINFKNPLNLKWYDTSNGEIIFNDSFLNSIGNKLIHLTDLEELMRQSDNEIEENSEYTNFKNTLYVMINPFDGTAANRTNLKCQYVYYNLCDPSVKQLDKSSEAAAPLEFNNIGNQPAGDNMSVVSQFIKSLYSIVGNYLDASNTDKIVGKLIININPVSLSVKKEQNPGIFIRYPDNQRIDKIYSSLDILVDNALGRPGEGYDKNNDKETVFNILQTFSKILVPLKKPNTPTTTSTN